MKLIDNKLYLTTSECEECGIASDGYIRKAKCEGTKCWDIINDPADLRKNLVGYEALNDDRKRKVEVRFGNPYDRVARQPILDMVVNDWKANEYFMGYRYGSSFGGTQDDIKSLPVEPVNRVSQYTRAAAWLHMLMKAKDMKVAIKKDLGLLLTEFYMHVSELIGVEKERGKLKGYAGVDVLPGDFPSSYQRLIARVQAYAKTMGDEGAEAAWYTLIDPLYGNKNASKLGRLDLNSPINQGILPINGGINEAFLPEKTGIEPKSSEKRGGYCPDLDDKQMAVIRALCAKPQNFDAGQVAELVNLCFSANGWKTLSRARLHQIITENMHVLMAGRQGKRAYMSKAAMQNKRKAPDYPLYYWTLDGWTVEMMYQERGPKGMEYKRLVMVVVLDPFNKYPVGYAIGERENVELIRLACRNAVLHMNELFGAPRRPLQLQSDNYQIKNLTPFYQVMAALYFTPAEVGNSKAKVIEPYFKHLNKKRAQKTRFWTGFNVDAKKTNQVNKEYLDQIKTQAPDRAGLVKQIDRMVEMERAGKLEGFMAGFAGMPEAENGMTLMGGADYLQVFGVALGKTNKITGQGIIKQINGQEYTFDSFDKGFRANMHLDWQLIGDPENLTRVLAVSPDAKMRYVLEQKRILPMDLHSTTQEDVDYRMRVKQFNKENMADITALYASDARIAAEVMDNTPFSLNNADEMDLKLMLTVGGQQKDRIQDAKRLGTGKKPLVNVEDQVFDLKVEERMNALTNIDKYLQ